MPSDRIVRDARGARASLVAGEAERKHLAHQAQGQRQVAADLLRRSRDALVRDHFAEALVQTMRRRG